MTIRSGQKHTLFDGTNVASTGYSYSNWVSTKYDSLTIQAEVATLVASWLAIRVEGRYDSDSRTASVYAERYTSAHRAAKVISDVANYGEMRVGVAASPHVASPNNIYCSITLFDIV